MESGSKPALLRKSRRLWIFVGTIGLCVVLAGIEVARYRQKYPYGWSHCCINVLSMELWMYAEDHGGRYPAGETSPEACLSLLYRAKTPDGHEYANPYLLRGMTVPEKTTKRILEGGGLLGPDSCGWHYVPGLTTNDDISIAIVWCKAPLHHNGEFQKDGGRQVGYVAGNVNYIPGNRWAAFLREQERLLSNRSNSLLRAVPAQ